MSAGGVIALAVLAGGLAALVLVSYPVEAARSAPPTLERLVAGH